MANGLEATIQAARLAVNMTSDNNQYRVRRLQNLRKALSARYSRTEAICDLEEAIVLAREIVRETPEDHPCRAEFFNGLANQLGDRYMRLGSMDDLEESIVVARQAVDAAPELSPNRAMYLNDLAVAIGDKYLRTGNMTDLDDAIDITAHAVDTASTNHPQWAMYVSNLGCRLHDRYIKTNAMADLEESIRLAMESINATPVSNYKDRAGRLHNLGSRLGNRYSRTGEIADLEAAIQLGTQIVDMVPSDHPNRRIYLSNLGLQLSRRYSRNGDMADLEEAIRLARQTLAATPETHADKPSKMHILATRLGIMYSRTKEITYLEESIHIAKQSNIRAPDDHPFQGDFLTNIGRGLIKRARITRQTADFEDAISYLRTALRQSNASPRTRIQAAHAVFLACTVTAKWDLAEEASDTALSLVPQLITRSLENPDKQYVLRQVVGLATDAAAVALKAKKAPLVALQYLERGRGVLAASVEEMRTNILELQGTCPELAKRFIRLRDELDLTTTHNTPLMDRDTGSSVQAQATRRYEAGNELDKVIGEIRKQPGFEDFLTAPNGRQMQEAASAGPIAVVNASGRGCDAVLIEQHQIRVVPLPGLNFDEIRIKMQIGTIGSLGVLGWLWDVVASPILDALGFTHPPSSEDNWPHMWWIPTGPLSKFPLHAAGHHRSGSNETVIDRVMSSYSPSINAIIRGRRRQSITPLAAANVLLVAMQETPEHSCLPFAHHEVSILYDMFKSSGFNPIQPGTSKPEVITHIPTCSIFHFAGHGYTDAIDPSQSSLLLDDWKTDPLTVASLLEMNLRESAPFLAYLSACGTAQIKDNKSIDESIHLISACQLAGFRHVIGTLWEVNDEVCVDVSRFTYQEIQNIGVTDESVCRALHKGIRRVRQRWLEESAISFQDYKSIGKRDARLEKKRPGSSVLQNRNRNGSGLPRDISFCDDDDDHENYDNRRAQSIPWVPYVHFGV